MGDFRPAEPLDLPHPKNSWIRPHAFYRRQIHRSSRAGSYPPPPRHIFRVEPTLTDSIEFTQVRRLLPRSIGFNRVPTLSWYTKVAASYICRHRKFCKPLSSKFTRQPKSGVFTEFLHNSNIWMRWNSFIGIQVTAKSSECSSAFVNEQTSNSHKPLIKPTASLLQVNII